MNEYGYYIFDWLCVRDTQQNMICLQNTKEICLVTIKDQNLYKKKKNVR